MTNEAKIAAIAAEMAQTPAIAATYTSAELTEAAARLVEIGSFAFDAASKPA